MVYFWQSGNCVWVCVPVFLEHYAIYEVYGELDKELESELEREL